MSSTMHPQQEVLSAPDAFRGAQQDLVARGAGLLAIAGGVTALLLMPFYPPTVGDRHDRVRAGSARQHPVDRAWDPERDAQAAPKPQSGVRQLVQRHPPDRAPAVARRRRRSSIHADAPAAGARRLGQPTAAALRAGAARGWAAALSPLLYSTIDVAVTVTEFSLLALISLMLAVVITSTRTHRARLKDAGQYANQLAHVDPLTGLPNRRAFDETLAHGIAAARLDGAPMSLLLCDVNSFKHVNDTLGHQAGDGVLKAIATALSSTMRGPDAAFRWAGDEFAVILSDTDGVGAARMAARVCEAVRLHCMSATGCVVTIGVGVAELRAGMAAEELLAEADAALLEHKAHPVHPIQAIHARGAAA